MSEKKEPGLVTLLDGTPVGKIQNWTPSPDKIYDKIYQIGEGAWALLDAPQHVGKIPERKELQCLPSNPEAGHWFAKCYSGGEVFLIREGAEAIRESITTLDGLKVGDQILCPSLVGYFKATVEESKDGLLARNGNHVGMLDFAKDDHHCWTCSATFNLAGIKKLSLYDDEGPL